MLVKRGVTLSLLKRSYCNCQVWRDDLVNTSHSPFARLRPLSLTQVQLNDTFWTRRREVNRTVMLPLQYQQCEATGRLNNFRRAAGSYKGAFEGIFFNDSDVYKWLEAASWTLATQEDAQLAAQVNETIALIAAAQDKNGYLNTYFTFERASERWTNLQWMHELYCAGHLIQAAIAHHRATGKDSLLTVAIRFADHILDTFGPTKKRGACGHPEIEMALVELARETGDSRYLDEALFFINERGQHLPDMNGYEYDQDHAPIREQHEIVGHAVRALYLYSGVTDIYIEKGEQALLDALEALWHNFTERKLYITGGAGARYEGESFGADYELPNERAYAETCAAIASVMWNWRLLHLRGEARFSDTLENALYNCVLAGVSLDGQTYFYQNPLADQGKHRRQPWFGTACCPPNIARLLASLSSYLYSTSDEGIWVHLYATSSATIDLSNKQRVTIQQQTDYPWHGAVDFTIQTEQPALFSLFLRIPEWATDAQLVINGEAFKASLKPGTYAEIRREWQGGDSVHLSLPMPVRLLESHPYVTNNHDRVAIMRGPLVYCIEQADSEFDIRDVMLPTTATWEEIEQPHLLDGIIMLKTNAVLAASPGPKLYPPYSEAQPMHTTVPLIAIPYYAWANRTPGFMQVWLPKA